MISFILMKRNSKNCQKLLQAKKEQYNPLVGIIEKKSQRIFHWPKLMNLNLET